MKNACSILAVMTVLACSLPTVAYAYLDPGTGSMLLQALIAAIVGGAIAIRAYWGKIKHLLSSSKDLSK